ncbi:transmembrane protein 68-like [Penaeus japonicus]|uniref:transmembrane protein 68-like n=1 Tax=Penaeus japonicus TaxID=27405 RepID=UPI001C714EF7|nr:transmembrane protein 68-like [Penaeus japonicus]XP_042873476.1 transmembrane protein 68-like [Penaeus japonicus]
MLMYCEDPGSFCSLVLNITSATGSFIGNQLDLLYLGWVASLLYPAILVFVILPSLILVLLYVSAFLLYIYMRRKKVYNVLNETLHRDPWASGRYLISLLWDAHGYIWHGYEVRGLENLPDEGPCLIIYYHGAIPIDIYYLVARTILTKGRLIHCVGDRFLEKVPGWKVILEAFHITPGTITSCVQTLSERNILSISPGGVREAQFSDHNYQLMWGNRTGFAKVAIEAKAPVVPLFTENLREAFRTVSWPQRLWIALYEKLRFPIAPIYGGFPVKLRAHLGEPIYHREGETVEELAQRIRASLNSLIQRKQKLPGNILRALLARFYEPSKND